MSDDAILESSNEVFAIAILEDAVSNLRDDFVKDALERRLRTIGIDIERLSEALRRRSLPFDVRRQAKRKVRETVARFPDDPAARNGLAETLREAGRLEEAIAGAVTKTNEDFGPKFKEDLIAGLNLRTNEQLAKKEDSPEQQSSSKPDSEIIHTAPLFRSSCSAGCIESQGRC